MINPKAAPLPQYGRDYVYGNACVVASKKQHGGDYISNTGQDGWYLPGGIWTMNQHTVKRAAIKMDALMRAGGYKMRGVAV